MTQHDLVRQGMVEITPDPRRVLARPFVPGQELASRGISRAEAVVRRVLDLDADVVAREVAAVRTGFGDRHPDLGAILRDHFALVAHRIPDGTSLSDDQVDLIGAYFTQEFALEGAAVCNPSIVADPSQEGAGPGTLRFILSLRAIGEGHVSTIGFRGGLLGPGDTVTLDLPAGGVSAGVAEDSVMPRAALSRALATRGDSRDAESVLSLLPALLTPADLEAALALSERDGNRRHADDLLGRIRRLARTNYDVSFASDLELSSRVLHPVSPAESRGMEDARFTTFVEADGRVTHYGTYTAYDGSAIAPHLLRTDDFRHFAVRQQTGQGATDKGMAMFPRKIGGRFWAVSRWDRENLSITSSVDALHWPQVDVVQRPRLPWDLVQLGSCASPIETSEGWLVVTHGVGPVRTYALGAMLLDLDDPRRVLGQLDEPLMTVDPALRNGYVPNVVYSCGALVHAGDLVLPYGCADASIRFAFVDLGSLLERLTSAPVVDRRQAS